MEGEPSDWIKIWAIFGPLVGIMLGAFGSWLQQWFSMRHSDKTRFHQLRVEVYSKYLHTANKIILGFLERRRDDNDLDNLIYIGGQISLIASNDVRTHVFNVNETIKAISDDIAQITQYQATYQNHIQKFIETARNELEASFLKKVITRFWRKQE